MDYFILVTKHKYGGYNYICAQNVVRQKNDAGEDVATFTCSRRLTVLKMEDVVGFFPQTPAPAVLSAL
jgi:hypothetical protein